MSLESIVVLVLVGAVAGWLANMFMSKKKNDLLVNIIIGVIGAFIGDFLFGVLGISISGLIGSIVAAFVGAIILLYILKLIK